MWQLMLLGQATAWLEVSVGLCDSGQVSRWSPHGETSLIEKQQIFCLFVFFFYTGHLETLGYASWTSLCDTGGTPWDTGGLKTGSGIYQFGQLGAWGLAACSGIETSCPMAG